jgi:hypothetical protein
MNHRAIKRVGQVVMSALWLVLALTVLSLGSGAKP